MQQHEQVVGAAVEDPVEISAVVAAQFAQLALDLGAVWLAAEVAWQGTFEDAIRALTVHPLVRTIDKAERIYRDMAAAHRRWLPDRLLPN